MCIAVFLLLLCFRVCLYCGVSLVYKLCNCKCYGPNHDCHCLLTLLFLLFGFNLQGAPWQGATSTVVALLQYMGTGYPTQP